MYNHGRQPRTRLAYLLSVHTGLLGAQLKVSSLGPLQLCRVRMGLLGAQQAIKP